MENEYVKYHVWEQYIKRDISVQKYQEKIQFSVSHGSIFSSNQIIGEICLYQYIPSILSFQLVHICLIENN